MLFVEMNCRTILARIENPRSNFVTIVEDSEITYSAQRQEINFEGSKGIIIYGALDSYARFRSHLASRITLRVHVR